MGGFAMVDETFRLADEEGGFADDEPDAGSLSGEGIALSVSLACCVWWS